MDYKQDSFSALNMSHNCLNLFHSSWEFTWDVERHQILSSVTLTDVETFKWFSHTALGDCGCMCPRGGAVELFKEALDGCLHPCHFTPFVSHHHHLVQCPMMHICLYEIFTVLRVRLYIIIRSQTYLTTLYSLCGLVHVTAEVICIISMALTSLWKDKVKSIITAAISTSPLSTCLPH